MQAASSMKTLSLTTAFRTSLFLLLSIAVWNQSIAAHSTNRNHNYLGANIDFQPNAITNLKLPINALKGSQVSSSDSLQINFKDKGTITIHTVTKESIGFSVDMRNYPSHIMGLKKTNEGNDYALLVDTAIKNASIKYQPLKTATFKTHNGNGYLVIGLKGSVIYLTDNLADNLITKIHIEDMSEQDINTLIIRGLL